MEQVTNQSGANAGTAAEIADTVGALTSGAPNAGNPGATTPVVIAGLSGKKLLIAGAIVAGVIWYFYFRKPKG